MDTSMSLEEAGYEVMTAEQGLRAIQHVEQNPGHFTCLITDFHMPGGVTGAHVVEHMRPRYPLIPAIITSAVRSVISDAWQAEHTVEFLSKPYDPGELVKLVGRLLQR